MRIGNREFDLKNRTYVMGILNMTPDSFSDGGRFDGLDAALFHVEQMVKDGVDIVDIGGESTRPGYQMISEEEEIGRVLPVIEGIRDRFDIPLSLDTYKSQVAKAGILAGADLINEIWGLKYDEKMAQVIAQSQVACCLMHNKANSCYEDLIPDLCKELSESVSIAVKAGIDKDRIILDPGIGFGKTYEQNLQVLKHLDDFAKLGYPLLLGTSKKSVIGLTLDVPSQERGAATVATTALAVMKGCAFVRVHDVKDNVHAVKMMEAILYG